MLDRATTCITIFFPNSLRLPTSDDEQKAVTGQGSPKEMKRAFLSSTRCGPARVNMEHRVRLSSAAPSSSLLMASNFQNEGDSRTRSKMSTRRSNSVLTVSLQISRHQGISFASFGGKCAYCGYFCMLLLAHRCRLVMGWSPSTVFRRWHRVAQTSWSYHSTSRVPMTSRDEEQETLQQGETVHKDATLTSRIRDSYKAAETDGILELARTISLDDYSPHDLIANSIEATSKKGQSAGIINAWIGACYEKKSPALAWKLLQAYDDISDDVKIYPDIVTLSLVYSCLCSLPNYQEKADSVLERATRMSKKMGGSKRRKALAAARRQGPTVQCEDVEHKLQELYSSDFRVLYEMADLVVLSKPSGMVCFHRHTTTAGKVSRRKRGHKDKDVGDVSLEDALLNQNVPLSTLNAEARGLVHRIDRGTSGCIVLAKTDDMHAKLVTQFFLRRTKKMYIALVLPTREINSQGTIATPVDGRPARSVYSILKWHGKDAISLQVETLTGRKHQVRVHCAKELDSPILWDPIYAQNVPSGIANIAADGRFFLHASSLVIPDFDINVEAPLPCWWEEAISVMEKV